MESLLNWGIEVVLWFQQFSPTLDLPFKILTSLGDKEFFLLLIPMGAGGSVLCAILLE
jgi:hypothetical protein